ncbi:MgtC/SapB family protein [Tistrella mobilis]|uniref:MgtC/SapB family protein n=1 Tax=Tistrella mobilis TaxID=171437 RepID=UPI0035579179
MPELAWPTPYLDVASALAIGALIGFEREKHKADEHLQGALGLRSFIIAALAGAVGALMTRAIDSPWPLVAVLLAVSGVVVASYVVEVSLDPRKSGATTELAAVATTALAALAVLGHRDMAVPLAVACAAALAFKKPLRRVVKGFDKADLLGMMKLLIASFIVLPLLPDRTLDPFDALNPYRLWLLVILITALGLVGYVAVRRFGARTGTLMTAVAGALVSSTAVTLSLARHAAAVDGNAVRPAAGGILIGWSVMAGRIAVLLVAVNPSLLVLLWPVLLALILPAMAGAAWLLLRPTGAAAPAAAQVGDGMASDGGASEGMSSEGVAGDGAARVSAAVANPFSLGPAIRFAGLMAVIMFASALAERYLAPEALVAVGALSGLADVDAITVSMAERSLAEAARLDVAAAAIVAAALVNTGVKYGLAATAGGRVMARLLAPATAVSLLAALAAAWLRL